MTYCRNCGCESHCGMECKSDARNGRGKFLGEVVCKHCRCELCDNVPRKESWPGPGVYEKKNGWCRLCKRRV